MMVRATVCGLIVGMTLIGCAAKAQPTARPSGRTSATSEPAARGVKKSALSSSLNSNVDPCAMRLHDICAPLLLYYARKQALPEKIDEIAQVPGFDIPELVCPVSGQKYIYNPHGPTGPEAGSHIILYDATPAHAGRRWGIAVKEPARGQALVAKVVMMP
ncbi:MAG: hypothetical protein QOF78_4400 [Phycisphaerales bacterium]|jgi:hypothetical protein|nr:hypothetical protein [Phycisphaerales bacterium]